MQKVKFTNPLKTGLQILLLLAISAFSLSGTSNVAYAGTSSSSAACGEMLANAEAQFLKTLAPDGAVPASAEAKAAAQEYIRLSKLCYEDLEANGQVGSLQGGTPEFIDEGGLVLGQDGTAEYVYAKSKWGTGTLGTSGGTVTYSFMGSGISFGAEGYGTSTAITSLPTYQMCFISEIQNAFAAWQAVSNIKFQQVSDNGVAFDAGGASGDIRIGAHSFDGMFGTLAHAYFPPPNSVSAGGDLHFDSGENWTCNNSGVDIGVVAMHEIGHSIGLSHENNNTAVMNGTYNPSLTGLQPDDTSGATFIYGAANLSSPPVNDLVANAKVIGSVPYNDLNLDTTGADPSATPPGYFGDGPQNSVVCDGKWINKGTRNVWYRYTPPATMNVSFDTFGSLDPANDSLDTYIAVWTSAFGLVSCGDDTGGSFNSQLVVKLNAGQQYYIEVAQYNGDTQFNYEPATGGTLKFHVIAGGGGDTTGVFRPTNGALYLKNKNQTGFADVKIKYGQGGDYPVVGDWDGNGTATIGIYRNGQFYLRNTNVIGFAEIVFAFGAPGDQPIAGDWNGDGVDTIGVYRPSNGTFFLRNSNSAGAPNMSFSLGVPGDVGIAGDWNGDGIDTTGVFRPSNGALYLKNTNATGFADIQINYGQAGDKPVTGDWDSNGTDTIGIYRNGTFMLRNSNTIGFAEIVFDLGVAGDMPIAGNWDGIP